MLKHRTTFTLTSCDKIRTNYWHKFSLTTPRSQRTICVETTKKKSTEKKGKQKTHTHKKNPRQHFPSSGRLLGAIVIMLIYYKSQPTHHCFSIINLLCQKQNIMDYQELMRQTRSQMMHLISS